MTTELLTKYIKGDASQREKEEVQLWLEASELNYQEFLTLRRLYDFSMGNVAENLPCRAEGKRRSRNRLWAGVIQIAAAVVITFACTHYYLMHTYGGEDDAVMQTLYVPAGQRAELTLTDGTKVWLNALTTFAFPNKFSETSREVYLDGEAYFDVEPDREKLFSVHTQEYRVNVLGTEFNVSAYRKNQLFETSLIKGSVEVVSHSNDARIRLTPGHRAYLANGVLVSSIIPNYDHFLWTQGILCFEHERMEDIFGKLELYYDIKIVNTNTKINRMRYTGKFRTKDGVEHVLNVLKIPTGLRYKKDNEKNIIYIR